MLIHLAIMNDLTIDNFRIFYQIKNTNMQLDIHLILDILVSINACEVHFSVFLIFPN